MLRGFPVTKSAIEDLRNTVKERIESAVGGPARLQIIFVLSSVLGLDAADKATVSATARSLEHALHFGATELGLLVSLVSFVAAIGTVPFGVLVDRTVRRRILMWVILLWSAVEAVTGASTSYIFMLVTRLGLGFITAAAYPTVASLTGDYFPAIDRARIYGLILGGELVGTGVGFFISGEISARFGWRIPFWVMAALGAAVFWAVWKLLPEPARGGQSWIGEGQEDIVTAEDAKEGHAPPKPAAESGMPAGSAKAQKIIREKHTQPREEMILNEDPKQRSLWWAISYVLRTPTYVLLIVASSLTYYFFSGVRTFGMIFLTDHFAISRSGASPLALVIGVGALAGIVCGGYISRFFLDRGWVSARIIVAGAALFLTVLTFAPGIGFRQMAFSMPLLTAGGFFLGIANPTISAARLDLMVPRLWGRAESAGNVLRSVLEGGAPLVFGAVSVWLGGGLTGLTWTFLIMLIPVLVAAALAIPASRSYPRDVATAAESFKRLSKRGRAADTAGAAGSRLQP